MTIGPALDATTALEGTPLPGAWVAQAACRDGSTTTFFAGDEVSVAAARRLCRRCPVRSDCAAYALALPDLAGVWGGLTDEDRRRLRRLRHSIRPWGGGLSCVGDAR